MAAHNPKTLQEAILYFASPDNCIEYLVAQRWPNGVICPMCGSENVSFLKNQNRWQCSTRHARRQFSIKIGTIFEDSPIGLDKWLCAMWMLVNCKNGVSSHEIHRAIDVTQKTAWFMLHRIRMAMQSEGIEKLSGEIEADETFIGGKARNMHKGKRKAKGRGTVGKAVVMGLLERHGEVRTAVVKSRRKNSLHPEIHKHVEPGSQLYTDELKSYEGLNAKFAHEVINHAECYARGKVHTNGLENFWCLVKRGLNGTYVSVEPFHLFRYLDEQAYRFNNRKDVNDGDRFRLAVSQIVGKRLTYAEVTGKVGETQTNQS